MLEGDDALLVVPPREPADDKRRAAPRPAVARASWSRTTPAS
jgi:hypothetical protein